MVSAGPPVSRRSRRGALARAVAVALALLAGGRAPGATATELRVGVPRLPVTLDPSAGVTPADLAVLRLCFEGLVAVGDRGEPEPALADQWSVSRDGLTWTFRLRSGLELWNGTPLQVDDVVGALAARISPEEPPEAAPPWVRLFRGAARIVREVRRGDAGSVLIQLTQPYAPLLVLLAHPGAAVAIPVGDVAATPDTASKPDGGARLVGTGPYRPVEQAPGRLVLEAVPGRRPPPRSDRVVLREVADEAAGLADLGPEGQLDVLLPQSPPASVPAEARILTAPAWQVGWLALRTDQGPFHQKAARQAAAFALDPGLLQTPLAGWGAPLSGYLPPGAWTARDVARPFDLARARRLLAQLGPAVPPVTLLAPDRVAGVAEAVRASLSAAGLKVRVRLEPPDAAAAAARRGEADLVLFEAPLAVDDPHFLLRPLLAGDAAVAGSATNLAFYRSPLVDGMLSRAAQLGFRPERLRLYQRIQTLLGEELPYVPLYVRQQWLVTRAEVRDARLDPSGIQRFERMWVDRPAAPAPPAGTPLLAPAAPAPGPPPPPPGLPAATP